MDAFGLDLSPAMVEVARRLNPGIPFRQGDMRALPASDGAWGGIAAFCSLIHIPPDSVADALRELRRVLRAAGLLVPAFHLGHEVIHLEEWQNKPVSLERPGNDCLRH